MKLGGGRIFSPAYADNLVLLTEKEGETKSMVERLEHYLGTKGLELNVGKTKVFRFRKGGGRQKSFKLRWRGKGIEEVKEYDYLGYRMQTNGDWRGI